MRLIFPFLLLSLVASVHAGEAGKVTRDIAYTDSGDVLNRLDVYGVSEGENHPVVVWIHGGGWQNGDKARVQLKPKAFNERGYVLVSVNYRFHPAVNYKQQANDIARVVRWVHDHAKEYGGDPGRIFLMGHSAGAHLAALVGTDGHYLKDAGVKLSDLSGVILLDGACYDIPRQIDLAFFPRMKELYRNIFTNDEATQKDASPITHVSKDKGIPPFLILHVASRRDSKAQSESLAAKLREADIPAKVVSAVGKTHATINQEFGKPDDTPTRAVFEFLEDRGGKREEK